MPKVHIYESVEYILSEQTIDEISNKITAFCDSVNADRKTAIRYRISVEESLAIWLKKSDGKEIKVKFETGKKLLKPFIKISVEGDQVNPYTEERSKDNFGISGKDMLIRIGLVPEYTYVDGCNTLVFYLSKKPKNQIAVLVSIIAASIVVGLLSYFFIPGNIAAAISENVVSPIESAFFRVLSAIAGPMIFLSVAWGVYGIGDVYTLGKIGKKMMLGFVKIIFIFTLIGCLFYPLLGPDITNTASSGSQFSVIFNMILEIVPTNIFSPFVDGNTLQIIFLAFIIGLSFIFLGQRTSSVVRAVEQINHIISFLMNFISKLVPIFVFIVLVNIIMTGSFAVFKDVWKFVVIFIVASAVSTFGYIIYYSIKYKQNPLKLIKAILPASLIGLSTASSSAAFETSMKICNNEFGIKRELSSFGVPFGMVIFKPSASLYYLLVCFYFASVGQVEVSLTWIVTAVIVSVVSAIATPPIPGGSSATYAMIFLQLGIPSEYIAMVVAIDMITDFLATSTDISMLLLEMFNISHKTGMVKNNK